MHRILPFANIGSRSSGRWPLHVAILSYQILAIPDPLVFGLDLKCLVLWQLLLLTCAAPTHAQKYLGKNTFIYLFVSQVDAGSQKCTQGTPSLKGRKNNYLKLVSWYLRSKSKYYANICAPVIPRRKGLSTYKGCWTWGFWGPAWIGCLFGIFHTTHKIAHGIHGQIKNKIQV